MKELFVEEDFQFEDGRDPDELADEANAIHEERCPEFKKIRIRELKKDVAFYLKQSEELRQENAQLKILLKDICDPTPSELANKANEIHEKACHYKADAIAFRKTKPLSEVEKENIKLQSELDYWTKFVDAQEGSLQASQSEVVKLNAMLIEQNIQVVKMTERIKELEQAVDDLQLQFDCALDMNGFIG